jgi:hypothetical protein
LQSPLLPTYLKVRKALNRPVVLSLTTSPLRIKDLYKNLIMIHPALYDKIHLNIPMKYKRTGESYDIPLELSTNDKIDIFRMPEDFGPATKSIPTIMRLRESVGKAVCISLDDDICYTNLHIGCLLESMLEYDCRAVIVTEGWEKVKGTTKFPAVKDFKT